MVREAGARTGMEAFVAALDADRGLEPGASPEHVMRTLTRLVSDTPEFDHGPAFAAVKAWLAHHGPEFHLLDATTAQQWLHIREIGVVSDLIPPRLARRLALAVHHDELSLVRASATYWVTSHSLRRRRLWDRVNTAQGRRSQLLVELFGVQDLHLWLTDLELGVISLIAMPVVGGLLAGERGAGIGFVAWFPMVAIWSNRSRFASFFDRWGR